MPAAQELRDEPGTDVSSRTRDHDPHRTLAFRADLRSRRCGVRSGPSQLYGPSPDTARRQRP